MDTKFTPGPWRVGEDDSLQQNGDLPILREKTHIALTYSRRPLQSESEEETQSNASLIAAAPELYAVLKGVEWSGARYIPVLDDWVDACPRCNEKRSTGKHKASCNLNAALAKARGEMTAEQILEREGKQ
jgi:hypothetical protein